MPAAARGRRLAVHFPPLRAPQRALFDARKRFNCWVCHRRFGKTTLALYCLIHDAYACRRPQPRFGYISPLFRQSKAIAWDALRRLLQPLPGVRFNEAELRADLHTGARLQLYGSDSPDTLRGLYFDGVVLDEAAQMRPRLWPEIVRPALADREGWAIHISTPLGHNAFYDLYQQAQDDPAWHTGLYRASETGIVSMAELASARAVMAPEQYAQEFEVSFESALIGSYYGSYLETAQQEGRVGVVPHQAQLPVHTAWDLGVSDATAIWFVQPVGQALHVIDYLEATDHGLEWYVRALQAKPYVYGRHYFPHDIGARDWSQDGRTRLQIAESLGLRPAVVVPRGDVGNGIQAVRTLFSRFWFDQAACHQGLEALKAYRREWNEPRRTWSDTPLHDWCLTGDTQVLTRCGMHPIMDLPFTGEVLTSCGWKAYHHPRITRKNAPLVEVVFDDGYTVRCTPEHLFKTASGWRYAACLLPGTVILSSLTSTPSILRASSTISLHKNDILGVEASACTAMSGSGLLVPSLTDAISTIGMPTWPTMPSTIWNACPPLNISPRPGTAPKAGKRRISLPWPMNARGPGMQQRLDIAGMSNWPSVPAIGKSGRMKIAPVPSVERSSLCLSVPMDTSRSIAVRSAKVLIIAAVNVSRTCEDVWCLTVPDGSEFSLANGALVHNSEHGASALRTFCMGWEEPRKPLTKTIQVTAGRGAGWRQTFTG